MMNDKMQWALLTYRIEKPCSPKWGQDEKNTPIPFPFRIKHTQYQQWFKKVGDEKIRLEIRDLVGSRGPFCDQKSIPSTVEIPSIPINQHLHDSVTNGLKKNDSGFLMGIKDINHLDWFRGNLTGKPVIFYMGK